MHKNVVHFRCKVTRFRSDKNQHYANAVKNFQMLTMPRLRFHNLIPPSHLFRNKSMKSDENSISTRQSMSRRWLNDEHYKRNFNIIAKVPLPRHLLRPPPNTNSTSTKTSMVHLAISPSSTPQAKANLNLNIPQKVSGQAISRFKALLPRSLHHGYMRGMKVRWRLRSQTRNKVS